MDCADSAIEQDSAAMEMGKSESPANPSPSVSQLMARFSQGSEKDIHRKAFPSTPKGDKGADRKPSDGATRSVLLSKPLQAKAMAGSDMYKHAPDFAPPPSLSRDQAVRLFILLSNPASTGDQTPTSGGENQTLSYFQMTEGLKNQPQVANMLGLPTKTAQEYHARRLFKLDLGTSAEAVNASTVTRLQFSNYFAPFSQAPSPPSKELASSPTSDEITQSQGDTSKAIPVSHGTLSSQEGASAVQLRPTAAPAARNGPFQQKTPESQGAAVVPKPSTSVQKGTGVPKLWKGGNTPRAADYDMDDEHVAPVHAASDAATSSTYLPVAGAEEGVMGGGQLLQGEAARGALEKAAPSPERKQQQTQQQAQQAQRGSHESLSSEPRVLKGLRRLSTEDSPAASPLPAVSATLVSPSHVPAAAALLPHSRFPPASQPALPTSHSPSLPVSDPSLVASLPLAPAPFASPSLPPPSPNGNPLPHRTPIAHPSPSALAFPHSSPSPLGRLSAQDSARFWDRVKQLGSAHATPASGRPPLRPPSAPVAEESAVEFWLSAAAPDPRDGAPPGGQGRLLRPSPVAGGAAARAVGGEVRMMAQLSPRGGPGALAGPGDKGQSLFTQAPVLPPAQDNIILEKFLVLPPGTSMLALQRSLHNAPGPLSGAPAEAGAGVEPVYWIKT